jgi:phage shock protein C
MPLHRSQEHCLIAGVCGGIAEWLGWSPLLVRILYVTGSALSAAFPGILVYLVLWIVMPKSQRRLNGQGVPESSRRIGAP